MCDPLIIDSGCRPTTITITDDQTTVRIDHKRKPQTLPMLIWVFGPIQEQPLGPRVGVPHMTTMTDTQQVTSQPLKIVDKAGQPSTVQKGSSVFTTTDPNVIVAEVDPTDETVVTVKAKGVGAATLKWTGDADLGDGVTNITASEDFVITGGQAVGASFSFGTPVEQTA